MPEPGEESHICTEKQLRTMIEESSIQTVLDRVDIAEVAQRLGIDLQQRGRSLVGLCPFHNERTGSFHISPDRGRYHCFGCGADGDAVSLVMEHAGMSYPEAMEWLAEMYGIRLERRMKEPTPEEKTEREEREAQLEAVAALQEFFTASMEADTPQASHARDYAFKRWGEEYCRELGIGYAPAGWQTATDWLEGHGVDMKALLTTGNMRQGQKSLRPYCLFRERVMIPVRDIRGRVIAFSGRYIGTEDQEAPKYINSPESPVYSKGKTVYGLDSARRAARRSDRFIIVEGAPDAIALQGPAVGLGETVAALGTAWTPEQLEVLGRFSRNLVFVPDADPPKPEEAFGAGTRAVMRNGLAALQAGFMVSVREIPLERREVRVPLFDYQIEEARDRALANKRKEARQAGLPRKEAASLELTDAEVAALPRDKIIGYLLNKQDPDSFVTDISVFNRLEDVMFPVWWGRLLFSDCDTEQELERAMTRICGEALLHLGNENLRVRCMELLSKEYGRPKVWRDTLERERRRRARENAGETARPEGFTDRECEVLRSLGVVVRNGCYMGSGKGEDLERWSNFVFRPVLQILDTDRAVRILRMRNVSGEERMVEFRSGDFSSLRDFNKRIMDRGNFIWKSESGFSLRAITEYIFEVTDSASWVRDMGWNERERYFALANGVWSEGRFREADPLGVVKMGDRRFFVPACSELYADSQEGFNFERQFMVRGNSGVGMRRFTGQLTKVYGEGAMVAFGWLLASVFRDVVFRNLDFFPMLNLFGVKGSGKTGLAKVLASWFYKTKSTPPSCSNTSIPTIAYMLEHAVNTVIVLDEFTNDLHSSRIDILKGVYGGLSRSKMSEEGNPVFCQVRAAVVLAGQYTPEDDAVYSRSVQLRYMETVFSPEQDAAYNTLMEMERAGNTHLLFQVLGLREIFEKGFADAFAMSDRDVQQRIRGVQMESRTRKCWTVPLAAFRLLEPHLETEFTYTDLLDAVVRGMREQNENVSRNSDTAEFWKTLETQHSRGAIEEHCHFTVKWLESFTPLDKKKEAREFAAPKRVVFINFPALRALLEERLGRQKAGVSMNLNTLESYLKAMPQYLGRKQQWFQRMNRFGEARTIIEGVGAYQRRMDDKKSVKAMCFDYDSLQAMYDINLESEWRCSGQDDDDGQEKSADAGGKGLFGDE